MTEVFLGYVISVSLALVVYGYNIAVHGAAALDRFSGPVWLESVAFRRIAVLMALAIWVTLSLVWPLAIVIGCCSRSLGSRKRAWDEAEDERQRERMRRLGLELGIADPLEPERPPSE